MKTIYKYDILPETTLFMPKGSKILCIQSQFNRPVLWAEIDTDKPLEMRGFTAYGTGHMLPEKHGKYIGTFQIEGGNLVFHVFENEGAE